MCCVYMGFLQGGLRCRGVLWKSVIQAKSVCATCARSHIWSGTYVQKTLLLNKFLISTLACIIVGAVYSVPPQGLWNAETLFLGSRCPVYLGKKQPSLDRMSVY